MRYIFIEGDECDRKVNIVVAENMEEAKRKYAKYLWKNDSMIQKEISDKAINWSFWEPYFMNMLEGGWDKPWEFIYDDQEKIFNKFKENLQKDFKFEVANDLYNFYKDMSRENPESLCKETKLAVGLYYVNRRLKDNYLSVKPDKEVNKIA